jgi:hypothetical protein
MVLFSLFFFPAGILVSGIVETLANLRRVSPTMKLLGQGTVPISGGLYPWSWVKSEVGSFKSLQVNIIHNLVRWSDYSLTLREDRERKLSSHQF